jgi:hypothetical protein
MFCSLLILLFFFVFSSLDPQPFYAIIKLSTAKQEDRMENTLGLIGAITGVAGLLVAMLAVLVSVLVVRRQEKVQARSDRLAFLSDRIFDISIPRNLRQPFYEEYISMKGNGTAVKFWLMEGEMKNKVVQGS